MNEGYMNPINATGLLLNKKTGKPLGTCFAFRQPTHFLTAAHCVGNLRAEDIAIACKASLEEVCLIQRIEKHPRADLALLVLSSAKEGIEPFWDCVGNFMLGEEFFAYGFPADDIGVEAGNIVERLFKGYFQRFFRYKSFLGYEYLAGELNISCPAGLSGGPMFRPGAFPMLTGLVVENIESATILDSVIEIQDNGTRYKEEQKKVINYGICVMLDPIKEWLDSMIPPRGTS